ncbi:Steroid monooxygenase (CpmA), putative [Penicillium digitatum PHI26]|uniref:Steroid monooxygenase (CpmA), putative n=2 Tax=Penicillium digitatum TaxID=36651 RepID=K9FW23_PEND2|nr:Steroid monooxygenase (CpmA), putative [Penicillium digitatum Pd1]EKV13830.1 Steroid monooxygenase (CpmA), putative [Penicillium digitatum PHI26]EKV21513.1 Steroid monooxygenase (CpmA), putative [Penicillium digitatum Pd1]
MDHCDRQIHIREHVLFNRTVIGAQFSQLSHEWKVSLDNLSTLSAKYLVSAIGVTSQRPTLMDKDLKLLNGEVYFPSNWPHREISPEGKDIAIIGTGSTAVQIVQDWGPRAKSLVVYQRCYNTALPIPVVPFDEIEGQDSIEKQEKAIAFRMKTPSGLAIWEPQKISTFDVSEEEREKKLNQLFDRGLSFWVSGYNDLTTNKAANRVAYDFWARKTRAKIHDRRKRDALAPLEPTYLFGIKRPGLDNGYFEQFNRPNVDVVNLRDTPIASFVHDGIVTTEGKFRHHDMVIPAIGFKNVIENMKSLGIKGLDGVSLGEGWADGVRTYLGLMLYGFPNFFVLCGPQAPSEQSNLPTCIDVQVNWIAKMIDRIEKDGLVGIHPSPEAMQTWNRKVYAAFKSDFYGKVSCRYALLGNPIYYSGGIPNYLREISQGDSTWANFEVIRDESIKTLSNAEEKRSRGES